MKEAVLCIYQQLPSSNLKGKILNNPAKGDFLRTFLNIEMFIIKKK